jgi:hypothetical protein
MNRFLAKPVALLIVTLGTLSACVAEVSGPPRPLPGPSRPQMCTFEHRPVCAQRGNSIRTFSNACLARVDGFRVVHQGQCRRPQTSVACPMNYMPVCAVSGTRWRTFSNSCLARTSGFRIAHQGRCR